MSVLSGRCRFLRLIRPPVPPALSRTEAVPPPGTRGDGFLPRPAHPPHQSRPRLCAESADQGTGGRGAGGAGRRGAGRQGPGAFSRLCRVFLALKLLLSVRSVTISASGAGNKSSNGNRPCLCGTQAEVGNRSLKKKKCINGGASYEGGGLGGQGSPL